MLAKHRSRGRILWQTDNMCKDRRQEAEMSSRNLGSSVTCSHGKVCVSSSCHWYSCSCQCEHLCCSFPRPRQAWLCSASLVTSTKKALLSVEWWLQKCSLVEVGIQSSLWWSQVCCSDLFSRENLLQGAQWINSSQLCGSLGSASTCKLRPHSPQAVSAND